MKKKTVVTWFATAIAVTSCMMGITAIAEEQATQKVRTIITTDGEADDQCSLVRYLLYANEYELEGIVSSSSIFHFTDQGEGKFKGKDSNQTVLDAYAQVYENLSQHAEGYPTPEYLTVHNYEGNVTQPGEMDQDTEGSLFIKECIMDDREDRLLLQAWGGCNTISAALRSIEQEYKDTEEWEEIYQKICNKIVIINDLDQDNTYSEYIMKNWENVPVIMSHSQYVAMAYPWDRDSFLREEEKYYYSAEYMQDILADKGALADIYLAILDENYERCEGGFLSEGDTMCFLYALDNGLRSFEDPTYGGWGGRYEQVFNMRIGYKDSTAYHTEGSPWTGASGIFGLYVAADDNEDLWKPIYRWIEAYQEDFAARLAWCTESYENANHEPSISVQEGIDLTAKAGEAVVLNTTTSDPDGDEVEVSFWQYGEADTYGGEVELTSQQEGQVSFTIPEDVKPNDTIHIIAEARDQGDHPITRYQRVIVTVAGEEETK